MHLIGLDKKLFVVQHKLTNEQLAQLQAPPEEFQKMIQQGVYNKTMELLFRTTKIKQIQYDEGVLWEYRMFMIGERDMYTLIKEILDLDEKGKEMLGEDCNKFLGLF